MTLMIFYWITNDIINQWYLYIPTYTITTVYNGKKCKFIYLLLYEKYTYNGKNGTNTYITVIIQWYIWEHHGTVLLIMTNCFFYYYC